jgi:hypothetical protein
MKIQIAHRATGTTQVDDLVSIASRVSVETHLVRDRISVCITLRTAIELSLRVAQTIEINEIIHELVASLRGLSEPHL